MRVYLSAAWGRREEILRVADRLRLEGVEITSNWLTEEEGINRAVRSDSYENGRTLIFRM